MKPEEKIRIENIISRIANLSTEEYCKITTLLSWNFFRIDIIDGRDIHAAHERGVEDNMAAAFSWKTSVVSIYTDAPEATIQKYLIHEFNHAIDSYNNLKNDFSRMKLKNDRIVGNALFGLNSATIGNDENLSVEVSTYQQYINIRLIIEKELDAAVNMLKLPLKLNSTLHQKLKMLIKHGSYHYIRYYGKDQLPLTTHEVQDILRFEPFSRFSGSDYDIWVAAINDRGFFEFLKSDPSHKPYVSSIKRDLLQ